jgi:hypothetical protein
MPARRLLVRTTVVALCATGAVGIVVLLARSFDDTTWRILGTTTAISLCALLAVPAGALLERGEREWLARSSAALTAAAFVLTVTGIWLQRGGDVLWKTWGIVGTLALAAAQGCGVEARRRDSDSPAVRALVAASSLTGAVLAALGVLAILEEISGGGFYRGLGALAILDVLLVVVVAVLRRGSGPIDQTHRVRVDGRLVESPGRDFAAAAANAIREAERAGPPVKRVERA